MSEVEAQTFDTELGSELVSEAGRINEDRLVSVPAKASGVEPARERSSRSLEPETFEGSPSLSCVPS